MACFLETDSDTEDLFQKIKDNTPWEQQNYQKEGLQQGEAFEINCNPAQNSTLKTAWPGNPHNQIAWGHVQWKVVLHNFGMFSVKLWVSVIYGFPFWGAHYTQPTTRLPYSLEADWPQNKVNYRAWPAAYLVGWREGVGSSLISSVLLMAEPLISRVCELTQ